MAPQHKGIAPVVGCPPTPTAVELWMLALPRKSAICLPLCLLLIAVCYIFSPTLISSDSLISYIGAEEHPETRLNGISPFIQETIGPLQLDISSSTQKTIQPRLGISVPSTQEVIPPRLDISSSSQEPIPPPLISDIKTLNDSSVGGCNIWEGEWILHPDGPTYTNTSCRFIHDHQNCIKNGRPDLGFLYWRWKPYDCELPLFDANAFLKIVAGKKWAFIGDSMSRNNFQSVLCLLSQVEMPEYNPHFTDFYFRSYDFTLAAKWAPFLVEFTEDEAEGFVQGITKLYLDVVDQGWAPSLHTYDFIVFCVGHWHTRPSLYFVKHKLVGGLYLPTLNVTDVGFGYGYRLALRTVFDFLISSKYKGAIFFRTVSPSHWENAPWNMGGNCTRKAPFQSKSITLEGSELDMYKIQLEEFAKTAQRSSEFSFKLEIVDVTHATLLRPDAHPGQYGYFKSNIKNDCLHWCLPGAVDTWSAMLLDVLRRL